MYSILLWDRRTRSGCFNAIEKVLTELKIDRLEDWIKTYNGELWQKQNVEGGLISYLVFNTEADLLFFKLKFG